jgi:hypothetical protein
VDRRAYIGLTVPTEEKNYDHEQETQDWQARGESKTPGGFRFE